MTAPDRSRPIEPPAPLVLPFPVRREHGLDWLRAAATVLVVLLHAGIPYMLSPLPGLAWPTHDARPSPAVDALCWWIDGTAMPVFFLLGGFVAAGLMARKGPRTFLAHRMRRLLVPFVFGCLVILPLDFYVWLFGWMAENRISLGKLQSPRLDPAMTADLWGVGHLWFLQYLFVFCLAAWGLHGFVRDRQLGAFRRTLMRQCGKPWMALPPALLGAFVLWREPCVVIGFRHSWYPLALNLLYYLPCFAFGWLICRSRAARDDVARHSEFRVALSLALFAWLLPWARAQSVGPLGGVEGIRLAGGFALFAWLSATGWFGVCLKRLQRQPPRFVQFLSEASFWVYLFHHPFVALAQVDLIYATLPAAAKFGVSAVTGLSFSLLTYQAFVRNTRLGRVVLGRPAIVPDTIQAAEPPLPTANRLAA